MTRQEAKIFGILGGGISYSLSPQIFRILFDKFGLPHGYYLFDIAEKNPGKFIESAKLLGVSGFNVTVPFKCSIMSHLDTLHRTASDSHSVNLVKAHNGSLTGYNTDIFGIREVFREMGLSACANKRILIIGAGGTGRTALRFFQSKRARNITIVNRSRRRLGSLLQAFGFDGSSGTVRAYESSRLKTKLGDAEWDIVFNATPVPTEQIIPSSSFSPDSVIFEAAYRSNRRSSLADRTVGGIDMLIYQALRGFEIFTASKIKDYDALKTEIKRSVAK
ncbi:MAG: shikimate dehydrogenase [candidate division Zixibacteria bacterium]|nr:shikimate dehydrogenase [candidate division Zixibacteria bacterium]MBU1470256.1 shikimate dehydrogenase [candidate division Zixibacteria bacterium]MBU2626426.1 shikimate dehydrogenase [candidate division Zixibacteria bacterium]